MGPCRFSGGSLEFAECRSGTACAAGSDVCEPFFDVMQQREKDAFTFSRLFRRMTAFNAHLGLLVGLRKPLLNVLHLEVDIRCNLLI